MVRLFFRLRRTYLIAWIVCLSALVSIYPPTFEDYYPELATRTFLVQTMQTTMSTRAMYGILENPGTIGQMTTWSGGAWVTLLTAVMAVLFFNSLYRLAEETGHSEQIRAVGVPQLTMARAMLGATAVVALILGTTVGAILWVETFFVEELTTNGALAFGLVTALTFMGAALLSAILAALLPKGSNAHRAGLLCIAACFIIRMVADTKELPALRWASPLGWRGVVKPYTDDDFGAGALMAVLCLGLALLWLALEARREYGAGRVPALNRKNPKPRSMRSLRWRLDQGLVLTWGIAVVALSAFLTSLSGSLTDLLANEGVGEIFKENLPTDDLQAGFLAQIAQLIGMLIAVACVQLVLRLRHEEHGGLVDITRATGISRWWPLGAATGAALAASILLVGAGTVAATVSVVSFAGDRTAAVRSVLYGVSSQLGPVIALTGLAVLCVGVAPRLASWAWAPVVYCVVAVILGDVLKLPEWARDLSVFNHTLLDGELGSRGWIPLLMITVGLALSVLGLSAVSRREVRS